MAVNKVVFGGRILIDLTSDTITPEKLAKGIVAHDSRGEEIVGTYEANNSPDGTPTISVNAEGLVTVTIGGQTFMHQIPTHDGGTYDGTNQTIAVSGKFMLGDIVIEVPEPSYTVDAVSGASYGFALNDAGYYESENKGVNSSYAICRVNFNIPYATTVYFDCINYAEGKYDYGLLGIVDTALALNNSADSSVYRSFYNEQSGSVKTVTYNMSAGEHFIDVKFIKDNTTHSNYDTLQFKVRFS